MTGRIRTKKKDKNRKGQRKMGLKELGKRNRKQTTKIKVKPQGKKGTKGQKGLGKIKRCQERGIKEGGRRGGE